MRLATLRDGTRDGRLAIVSSNGRRIVPAAAVPTLQVALDRWSAVSSSLAAEAAELEHGPVAGELAVDPAQLHAPLPRAYEWIDGSAYINHIVLVRKARGAQPPPTLTTEPLVYQGGSGTFLGPRDPIAHFSDAWGIDFESEVCVIVDDVPMGTTAAQALGHIRLLMLANDVTLRALVPDELEKGFGFFVSKPSTAFSPFAVTPDELGSAWHDGRVHLPLRTTWNGKLFGDPNAGPEMHFSFLDLIAHAAKTRKLTAGTIVGSGTVSNADPARGASCIAEVRVREKIDCGMIQTPFMRFGDTVEIEMFTSDGASIFGSISQRVVQVERTAAP
jgi:fumarylacetoacetate (FAA) hydrolase